MTARAMTAPLEAAPGAPCALPPGARRDSGAGSVPPSAAAVPPYAVLASSALDKRPGTAVTARGMAREVEAPMRNAAYLGAPIEGAP